MLTTLHNLLATLPAIKVDYKADKLTHNVIHIQTLSAELFTHVVNSCWLAD